MFNQPCHGLKATHKGLGACICRTVAMHGWLRGDAGRGAANSHDSPVPCFVCSVYRPSAHKNLIIRVFVNPSTSIHAVTSARFVALPLLLRHLPCMQLHRFSPRGLNRSVVPQRKGRKYAPVVRRASAAAAPPRGAAPDNSHAAHACWTAQGGSSASQPAAAAAAILQHLQSQPQSRYKAAAPHLAEGSTGGKREPGTGSSAALAAAVVPLPCPPPPPAWRRFADAVAAQGLEGVKGALRPEHVLLPEEGAEGELRVRACARVCMCL